MIADRSRAAWENSAETIAQHTNSAPVDWDRVDDLVIHYTGADRVLTDTAQQLRNIQHDYVTNRGYSIGYSYAIDQVGVCWELRGETWQPAATKGHNQHTVAILCLVNGQDPLTQPALERARRLIAELRRIAGRTLTIHPHKFYAPTSCPGAGVSAQIAAGDLEPEQDADMLVLDSPSRLYDSRKTKPLAGGTSVRISAPPGARAVFVNLTAVEPAADGHLIAWSGTSNRPTSSNVNYGPGRAPIAGSAWVPCKDGQFSIWASSTTHLVVDLQAWQP
jgi:hypothetical protein